jgi:hypothetical protein
MIDQDRVCPKCGEGEMKAVPATDPLLADQPREKPMQARCNNPKCGYEDDFTKFYPIGREPE